jgi:uncharacterized tellurite resistance protein B-like protein
MDLTDLKYLPKSKRLSMANCVLRMVFADGVQHDNEWEVAAVIFTEHLEISAEYLKQNIQSTDQIISNLRTMDGDELYVLGLLLGAVSKADGNIAQKELDLVRGVLSSGGLRSDNVEEIVKWIKK